MDELLARIRAALRRATPAGARRGDHPGLHHRPGRETAHHPAGDEVRLTPTEWHMLEVLARHPDKLVVQKQLLREVWGPRYEHETNYLRVHLANLRRKIEPDPSRPRYLITEPGIGYRFTPLTTSLPATRLASMSACASAICSIA
jgi:two-component system KDP operon response regulator KdpE